MRSAILAVAVGAVLSLCSGELPGQYAPPPAGGAEIDAEAAHSSPLLTMAPEARQLSAPEWVKVGTRITFYGMSGSTPQGGYTLDPSDEGEWVDPKTGQRYAKNDAVGAGGEGYAQFDVIALGRSGVAISANLYTILNAGNPPQLMQTPMGGMTAAAAGPADLWVHPAILQQAQQFHTPNFFILRGPYRLPQAVYNCLCIVSRSQTSYSSHAYDLNTGVLISGTTTSEGRMSNLRLPGEDPQRGNRGITIVKFVGIRQLNTPGIRGKNPPWVGNLRAMHFGGQCEYVNQYDPSVRMTYPSRMDIVFQNRGENWCRFTLQSVSQIPGAPPQQGQFTGICGPAGAFWIDPAALAPLQMGQVLDEDPVTHIRTAVTGANPQQVQITMSGPGVGGQLLYDRRTGMLQAIRSVQPTTGITTMLQLMGTE